MTPSSQLGSRTATNTYGVTVAIPTYNGERYLSECLTSVLSQTFHDIEILVVDDWSTDRTLSIAGEFAKRDSRVRVERNERNLGLVGNWNRCIDLARGKWLKFAFQDDVLHSKCLELMLQAAKRPIVFCHRSFIFEDGIDGDLGKSYQSIPTIGDLAEGATDISPEQVRLMVLRENRNFLGEPTAALLHRSVFERFGRFNCDLAQFCDQEFWIRVATNTGLAYVPEPLAAFRVHARSMSASNRDPTRAERVDVFDWLIILHEFAYNPHFALLGREARHVSSRRHFKRELAKKACWVRTHSMALASARVGPDTSWITQWDRLIQRYPRIRSSVWHVPYRVRDWMDRHLGWRLNRKRDARPIA